MSARTVLELIRAATDYLKRQGVESPRLDAETLLADVLGGSRLDLYVKFDMPVDEPLKDRFRERLVARARGAPTSHLTGAREFYGRRFKVDRRALAPRPETEHLVDAGLAFLRARRAEVGEAFRPRCLEIGVGGGCVVGTLAAEFPDADYLGTDISPAALELARENLATAAPTAHVELFLGDLWAPVADRGPFDLVVSNPPYVADDEWADLPDEVRNFDPPTALKAGADPTSFLGRIVAGAAGRLAEKARIALEGGRGLPEFVAVQKAALPTATVRLQHDLAGLPRVVVIDVGGR